MQTLCEGREGEKVVSFEGLDALKPISRFVTLKGARGWVEAHFPLDKCVGWPNYGQEMKMRLL